MAAETTPPCDVSCAVRDVLSGAQVPDLYRAVAGLDQPDALCAVACVGCVATPVFDALITPHSLLTRVCVLPHPSAIAKQSVPEKSCVTRFLDDILITPECAAPTTIDVVDVRVRVLDTSGVHQPNRDTSFRLVLPVVGGPAAVVDVRSLLIFMKNVSTGQALVEGGVLRYAIINLDVNHPDAMKEFFYE